MELLMDFSSDSPILQHKDFLYKLRDSYNFYIDHEIFQCDEYKENNIAYIVESGQFVSEIVYKFKLMHQEVLSNYKIMLVNDYSLLKLDERVKWSPPSFCWIEEPSIRDKSRLVSMISSSKQMCDGHKKRLEYVNKYKGKLDLFGRGHSEIEKKEQGLDGYMFSVAIENDQYGGYFTEKIIDCFATGTIPIYLGDPQIDRHFNMDGVIVLNEDFDLDSLTPDLYYSKLDSVRDNFERSKQFFSAQNYIYNNYLKDIQ
jgi:hypothetical protein